MSCGIRLTILAASFALFALHCNAFQTWTDCGSTETVVWGVNIEPRPQVLGKNWTIYYVFVPKMDLTAAMGINVTISVYIKGQMIHQDSLSLCDTKDPVAISDGYGQCPYKLGVPYTIHDVNVIPSFLPVGPYQTFVTYSTNTNTKVMCATFNQTYAEA